MSAASGSASRPRRVGGQDRVTGLQRYVADIHLRRRAARQARHRADCARARIVAIDTSAAERGPRRPPVVTAADLPQPMPRFGPQFQDRPVLAVGETKYHGEPVAAVAADTPRRRRRGGPPRARRVRGAAGRLHRRRGARTRTRRSSRIRRSGPTTRSPRPTSCASTASAGATSTRPTADLVVERTLHVPDGHPLRDRAARLHGRPGRRRDRRLELDPAPELAPEDRSPSLLGLPLSKVRVFAPDPGGGFGGKQHAKYEPLVAFMALRAGRPVRLVLSLEETFQAVRRGAAEVRVRTGLDRDGTLVFRGRRAPTT